MGLITPEAEELVSSVIRDPCEKAPRKKEGDGMGRRDGAELDSPMKLSLGFISLR